MFLIMLFMIGCYVILFNVQCRYLKKKAICIVLIGILSFGMFGCSSQTQTSSQSTKAPVEQPKEPEKPVELQKPVEPEKPVEPPAPQEQEIVITDVYDPMLTEEATAFEPIEFRKNNIVYTLIGGDYGTMDSTVGGHLNADDAFALPTGIEVSKGLFGISDSIKNRDRILVLYFKIVPSEAITSPRDIPETDLDVKVVDDQGEELLGIYDTVDEELPSLDENLDGISVFLGYSDTKYFIINLDGQKYKLIAENMKLME